MKYRNRTDITSQILEVSREGTSKTKIMYKAFLSYVQLKEYMEILIANDLLEMQPGGETFKTTPKGLKFLQICNKVDEFMVLSHNQQTPTQ